MFDVEQVVSTLGHSLALIKSRHFPCLLSGCWG